MKNERCGNEQCDPASAMQCVKCEESKMCFKWAVTRALNPVTSKPERITKELRELASRETRLERNHISYESERYSYLGKE